ncbi:MAG: hypothetical protein BWX80_00744 [Candidatus Hydrogenedentes bacterium ADurb.Bin101]|mgnify:CR=1 FL=1|nr:MAG: hypothetical protein BWX80_00744 [Candidatus Hydrogenedentes bacterium ADurb.Bin101]HOH28184.1 hypothetical protein [Candidatus Hydrogenedentota bacterium]
MRVDAVLRAVYRAKDQLNREVQGDVGLLCTRLRNEAAQRTDRVVVAAPKRKRNLPKRPARRAS